MPTSRFEYERMFTRADSGLPPACRHVLHVLAMYLDKDEFLIRAQFQPSITDLTEDMGCDRKTTTRRLARTELAGWIIRMRPTKHQARTRHARTFYLLTYPAGFFPRPEDAYPQARGANPQGLGAQMPGARGANPQGLGAQMPGARGEMDPRLGAQNPGARGTEPLQSSLSSDSYRSTDELSELVIRQVRDRTGRVISAADANRINAEMLARARGTVRAPESYLTASLANMSTAELGALVTRNLVASTPTPPTFRSLLGPDGRFLRKEDS